MAAESSRVANISIVINDKQAAGKVNEILSKHGEAIQGRLGIPYKERGVSIIIIVVDAGNNEIGAISGALGNVDGVTLRSTMLI